MKWLVAERKHPYHDDELKQVLMENLFHKKDELIVYVPACLWRKMSPSQKIVNENEESVYRHRLIWEFRVKQIYRSIHGFASKPRLGMEWDYPSGDLYIQLCW